MKKPRVPDKVKDAFEDDLELAIDKVWSIISAGQKSGFTEIAGDISIVKNTVAGIKLAGSVWNYRTVKKMKAFVDALRLGDEIVAQDFNEFREKHGDDKIIEEIIARIDRFESEKQAQVQAFLYKALIAKHIDWDRFISLNHALEQLDPTVIGENPEDSDVKWKYVSTALAYVVMDPGSNRAITLFNGNFFNDFKLYGLEPYRQFISSDSEVESTVL